MKLKWRVLLGLYLTAWVAFVAMLVAATWVKFPLARADRARQDMQTLASAIRVFHQKHSRMPPTLDVLVDSGMALTATDFWGRPYVLIDHGTWFGLMTFGEDGVFGGDDLDDAEHVVHFDLSGSTQLDAARSW